MAFSRCQQEMAHNQLKIVFRVSWGLTCSKGVKREKDSRDSGTEKQRMGDKRLRDRDWERERKREKKKSGYSLLER